jgi:hypothetical protein
MKSKWIAACRCRLRPPGDEVKMDNGVSLSANCEVSGDEVQMDSSESLPANCEVSSDEVKMDSSESLPAASAG